ncbi:hypothetical protein ABH940_006701 [Streptacidiphilus sp. BW17]
MSGPRPAYPEYPVPFDRPMPGARTWTPPARSHFGTCNAATADDHVCPVDVYRINGRVMGCDCSCHDERRVRLRGAKR